VYIVVDDIENTLAKAVELGGRVTGGKMRLGAGFGAFIADPEGNVIGLYQDPAVS
jgi:predicted enzyme related to lactoylglutathione lyase